MRAIGWPVPPWHGASLEGSLHAGPVLRVPHVHSSSGGQHLKP